MELNWNRFARMAGTVSVSIRIYTGSSREFGFWSVERPKSPAAAGSRGIEGLGCVVSQGMFDPSVGYQPDQRDQHIDASGEPLRQKR